VGAPSASLADLADAGLAALDRVAVGSGVAQPGDRFARCRVHQDRVLLARLEGVILAPLAQADDEGEKVLALLGQHVLLVGAATGCRLGAQDAGVD